LDFVRAEKNKSSKVHLLDSNEGHLISFTVEISLLSAKNQEYYSTWYNSVSNVDIHVIVSTIENYENRTVTLISVNNNSVQSTVTNNNSVQQTVIALVPTISNSHH
jgi:hypothetical protein